MLLSQLSPPPHKWGTRVTCVSHLIMNRTSSPSVLISYRCGSSHTLHNWNEKIIHTSAYWITLRDFRTPDWLLLGMAVQIQGCSLCWGTSKMALEFVQRWKHTYLVCSTVIRGREEKQHHWEMQQLHWSSSPLHQKTNSCWLFKKLASTNFREWTKVVFFVS